MKFKSYFSHYGVGWIPFFPSIHFCLTIHELCFPCVMINVNGFMSFFYIFKVLAYLTPRKGLGM